EDSGILEAPERIEQGTVLAWEKGDLFPTKAFVEKMAQLRARGPGAIPKKAKGADPMKVLADPAVATLRRTLALQEADRAQKLMLFTPDHPLVVKLNKDILETKALLYRELVKFNDATEIQAMIEEMGFQAKRDAAAGMFDDIEKQIVEFPEKERGLIRLERERELLEKVYVLMAQELEQTRLAVEAQDTTFTILDRAIKPSRPKGPRKTLFAGLAFVLVFLAGLWMAADQDRRARSVLI
ncbi:MAG: GNVR domain-containing protein, partial [bacterium]